MLRPLLPILALVIAFECPALAADTGKHAEALAQWDTVSKSSDAQQALAYATQLDDMDDAERDVAAYQKAVELMGSKGGKDLVQALDSLASAQAWHGQYDVARATAAKALEAAGSDAAQKAHALSIAGNVELAAGAYPAARTKFDGAASAAGSDATEAARAATGIGNVLDRLNDYAGAKAQLVKAAKAQGEVGYLARWALAETQENAGDAAGRVATLRDLVAFAAQGSLPPIDAANAKVAYAEALADTGQFDEAKKTFDAVIADLDALVGADSPAAAKARIARASATTLRGDSELAYADFRAGLAILRASRPVHPDLAEALRDYATFAYEATSARDRVAALEEALDASEATRGPNHPDTADVLVDLGRALNLAENTYGAYIAVMRARAIYAATTGEGHHGTASVDHVVALLFYRWSFDDDAWKRFQAVLPIADAAYGKDNPALVALLQDYANEANNQNGEAGTKKPRQRAVSLAAKQGPSSVASFRARYQLVYDASTYNRPGDAISLGQALVADESKVLAPSSNDLARARNTVAYNQDQSGKNAEAKASFESATAAYAAGGVVPRSDLGKMYRNAGNLATEMGDTALAVDLYAKALRIYELSNDPFTDTASVADTMQRYAGALGRKGDEALSNRAHARQIEIKGQAIAGADIAIGDATLRIASALAVGSDRLAEPPAAQAAASLLNGEWSEAGVASEMMFNAVELHLMGRTGEAAALANLALDIAANNIVRPPNSRGETTVTNLDFESAGCVRILGAMIFARQGDVARAKSVLESAPAAFAGSPRKASYVSLQGELAGGAAWLVLGDTDRANKAISSAATTYGNMKLNNPAELVAADAIIGTLFRRAGQADQGNKAIDAALQTCDQAARCGTPNVAWAVTLAAWERRAAKDPAATDLAQRAMDIWEQDTDVLVRGLQEHERRAVDRSRRVAADLLLDLERKDSHSVLESMLKSEAASREAEVDDPAFLWQSISSLPELVTAVDKVRDLRTKLSRFVVVAFDPAQGEIRRFRTDQQAHEVEDAETALAKVDPKFASNQMVSNASLEDICKGMPAGSVLLHVRRYDAGTPGYAAHVVTAGTCAVTRVDLGAAKDVDGDVGAYRSAAIAHDANAFAAASKQVASRIWTPVAAKVGTAKTVFVVPDGSVGGVSFAALPEASGYLVERHAFVYLDAPGDVLRWKDGGAAGGTPQVYGGIDPELDLARTNLPMTIQTTHAAQSCRGFAIGAVSASPAAGAHTGADAIEPKVDARAPLLFQAPLADGTDGCRGAFDGGSGRYGQTLLDWAIGPNRFRTVGVALSGYDAGVLTMRGNEDGIWTAEEIAQADLRAARTLVVTGGDAALGAGGARAMYGGTARSGARNVVLALWPVSTPAWVAPLASSATPTESLRQAQTAAAKKSGASPWDWGAWVIGGDWR
jgi:hypothetical protein